MLQRAGLHLGGYETRSFHNLCRLSRAVVSDMQAFMYYRQSAVRDTIDAWQPAMTKLLEAMRKHSKQSLGYVCHREVDGKSKLEHADALRFKAGALTSDVVLDMAVEGTYESAPQFLLEAFVDQPHKA